MTESCGIVTFFSSQHAISAEKVLKAQGFEVELIPGPKDISPNCGVALKYDFSLTEAVKECLLARNIRFEACHEYVLKGKKSILDRLLGR